MIADENYLIIAVKNLYKILNKKHMLWQRPLEIKNILNILWRQPNSIHFFQAERGSTALFQNSRVTDTLFTNN